MQWPVQIIVALLNIAWIAFFLQPDPLSVFVQRRSTHSSDEFCIQPPPAVNWTPTVQSVTVSANETNNSNTTTEASGESNLTLHESHSMKRNKIQRDCQCNTTNKQPKDLFSSQLSHIELRPPAPGCEPKIIMTFGNMEVCIDVEIYFSAVAPLVSDSDGTTPASPPPELGPTSSEVPTASGLMTTSVSAVALYTTTYHSKAPVQQKDSQNQGGAGYGVNLCCIRYSSKPIPLRMIKGYKEQSYDSLCPLNAIILFTAQHRSICVDPKAQWVQRAVKTIQSKLKKINNQ